MPDFSNRRPDRWWVLEPEAHHLRDCARCGADLELAYTVPMLREEPLCAVCAGKEISGAPLTPTYIQWLEDGDPRWWSPWMCNCASCFAEGALA